MRVNDTKKKDGCSFNVRAGRKEGEGGGGEEEEEEKKSKAGNWVNLPPPFFAHPKYELRQNKKQKPATSKQAGSVTAQSKKGRTPTRAS